MFGHEEDAMSQKVVHGKFVRIGNASVETSQLSANEGRGQVTISFGDGRELVMTSEETLLVEDLLNDVVRWDSKDE